MIWTGRRLLSWAGRSVLIKMVRLEDIKRYVESQLDGIEDKLDYGKWYCGHYHMEKKVGIMFDNFDEIH